MTISISSSPSVLIEEEGTLLTLTVSSDEPIPEDGLELTISSELENALGQFDVFAAQFESVQLVGVTDDTSGFRVRLQEETGTITLPAFDDQDADSPLELTFSVEPGEGFTVDENAGSVTVTIEDEEGGMTTPEPTPEPPTTPDTPEPGVLQVSLFGGPSYLIEDEGTVSAHAFLATNGVIPEGGLVVSVDAPNLSEFDLAGVSVEGGEIEAVRDGGFDLRMREYTTLVNLPVADDGETESAETAIFSLTAGEGYEIVSDYSSGTFNLVDTEADIPKGAISEPNHTITSATDTQISPENPTFSGTAEIYFDIGDRYLKEDGTYQYIDYSEDVDVYKVELNAGDTITAETFDFETNLDAFGGAGIVLASQIYDAEGNPLRDNIILGWQTPAAPDKLFGGISFLDENETDTYQEFTAPDDGTYYIAFGNAGQVRSDLDFLSPFYNPLVPGSGQGNRSFLGDYGIAINLLTEDNPRGVGVPTPPVSNPNVTDPPTLSLSATPTTIDSEGNFTSAVVERAPVDGVSSVTFTIEADGEIPEGGIEFVLNSDANLFDYVSLLGQNVLPNTIGGQSLGAFYNEDGSPTGIRLLIEEPIMTVGYEASRPASFLVENYADFLAEYEPIETDGAEDVTFFIQPGEGYDIAPDSGTTEVTYYDSLEDVPASTGGGDTVPEVGVTVSESTLIESEGTETTLTFTLSEPPPEQGVTVFIDSDDNATVGSILGQFNVLEAEIEGGNFPIPNSDSSGFFFNITEQTAAITLSVFDELSVGLDLPLNTFQEGIFDLTFALQPLAGYTIDPNASEINLALLDNPESQIQVSLTGSTEADEDSTTLIESEGTVSVHTFSLSALPPAEGLTVTVNAPNLSDFDLDAIEVAGGTVVEVRNDSFDLTITEREATINLPILEDGTNEGSETATFTLESSNSYEINAAATEATFTLADTVDQISSASGDIEVNDTIPEANALGLSTDTPSTSVNGLIGFDDLDLPEDVDLYSFNLEAGQTVSLDIDTKESLVNGIINFRPVVKPELSEILQTFDTELRLFDADGNELAANNDGAAPDEEFSRDPYLEYTAETAGTYYVGVSQLGNRNYDPFVFRDGSGWTFPEVGVFNGFYDLTVSLVNVNTEQSEKELVSGTADSDILIAGVNGFDGVFDTVFTGAGNDEVDAAFNTNAGQNRVNAGSGDDIIYVTRKDRAFGSNGDDVFDATDAMGGNRMSGGEGNDTFFLGKEDRALGGAGDDIFYVQMGGDNILSGGMGADQFWIATAETPDAANIITEFTSGEDVLGIAGLGIGFDDLSITQQDDNTLIAANGSDLAILQGISAGSLIADNFAFA